jgi:TRAP transporter TAXI family solute receptor
MRRMIFACVFGSLILLLAASLAVYLLARPTILRVAVGPANGDDQKLIVAVAQLAARDAAVRLKLVEVDGPTESARALERGDADLAVVRSDEAMPANGLTAVILHRNAVLLLAPNRSPVRQIGDLRGRSVGVIGGATNSRLLDMVLQQYGVAVESVTKVETNPGDVARLLRERRIDVVLAVGIAVSGLLPELVASVAAVGGGQPVFIPIEEAEAISQRLRVFESQQVVTGTFGGTPARPAKEFDTLSVSYRLVARKTLPDAIVAQVTSLVFSNRQSLANSVPLADRIEAPSTEKGAALPVHPGAAAYLDDDEQSFIDRYSDYIYMGAMVLSVIGSGVAALASRLSLQGQAKVEVHMARLVKLLAKARAASSAAELDGVEQEADEIVAHALARPAGRGPDVNRVAALGLALEHLRAAIADRRRLTADSGRPDENAPRVVRLNPPGSQAG